MDNFDESTLMEHACQLPNLEDYCDVYTGSFWRLSKAIKQMWKKYHTQKEYFDRFAEIWLFIRLSGAHKKLIAWMVKVLQEKNTDGPYTCFRRIRALQAQIEDKEETKLDLPDWDPKQVDDGTNETEFILTPEAEAK